MDGWLGPPHSPLPHTLMGFREGATKHNLWIANVIDIASVVIITTTATAIAAIIIMLLLLLLLQQHYCHHY